MKRSVRKKRASDASSEGEFRRASACWDRGDLKRAFAIFQSLAKRGDVGAQLNVGYFFDQGIGVSSNPVKALYWYRRGYRKGDPSCANNIATIYRDRGDLKRAVAWFLKAIRLGDDSGALELAKIYLDQNQYRNRVVGYLTRVSRSENVTESAKNEAARLLKRLT